MPNWCRNYAIISGRPEQITWLSGSIANLNIICPEPRFTRLGARSEIKSWHQANWGCDRNLDPDEIDVTFLSVSEGLIDQRTEEQAQAILRQSPHLRGSNTRAETPALLKGLLFGSDVADESSVAGHHPAMIKVLNQL